MGHRFDDRHFLRADVVEPLVWDKVSELLRNPERLLEMAHEYLGLRTEAAGLEHDQVAAVDSKVAGLE